jgi:hypothetical protein
MRTTRLSITAAMAAAALAGIGSPYYGDAGDYHIPHPRTRAKAKPPKKAKPYKGSKAAKKASRRRK